ncbi:HlyD family type I secretion periplasmic adaptor subunit [Lichenifustis flavocetrariae]|uniref:Membrane fusion protein (MFP) family protein n=1 Tax=Lichenifustis flavocetrariae TaxID=2949735 RepID=A0AA41Z6J2_9HYPH|nr:HlyD family type I secretion periplasmic adaptor subunit [Lichenifustis flavocetrariae]MCW6511423.1 HlyD family type I secretion periplasmic adaptor subunit [Lichenifustis flavocetrariae]
MSTQTDLTVPPQPNRLPALVSRLPALLRRNSAPARTPALYTEFLPAHLEILERPASPKMHLMLWTICGMLAAAIAWSTFARIDIFAEAQGRIQPSGRSKVVQPLDVGRVSEVAVQNGSVVKAGDLLVQLDATLSQADRTSAQAELQSLHAEIARRGTEIAVVQSGGANASINYPGDVPEALRKRDDALFQAEISQYQSQVDSLKAQLSEKTAHNQRLKDNIVARQKVINFMAERLNMKQTLEDRQSGSHAAVIDASQQLENEQRNLMDDHGQVLENDAAVVSLQRKLDQAMREFLATQNQKLSDAERRREDVEQNYIKANNRVQQARIVAPIDGTVQQLAVTTVGQVVTSGQPLMVIVPSTKALEVMALVQNQDIGFIKVGQEVVLKVDAFPFSHYGTLKGTVKRISNEAVDSQEATASSDASTLARPINNSALSGNQKVQNLVYPVTVEMDKTIINADGKNVPLLPGMMVTAEIQTGDRRVIQYALAPIWEASSQAAHER